ncbi:trimeric intracellular cation channel family protein [Nitrincola tapanii]|uniref:Trimeric intracellular cation channel family protein n=1 Tax=Nitrincola tapanii TaxID=1708751 RepID=A0A5A9W6E8_9GAMM|nr:trimeric intracellular cation channel family protein [Nitrincola tapanii]KAA0875111.1 trimeric intracellular cation channel family protein [Nitrincola tapanii]
MTLHIEDFVYYADLLGVAVFAVTGVLAAQGKQIDLFGVMVLAVVTALGGGTIRDLALNAHPLIWIADPILLWTALGAALLTFVLCRYWPYPRRTLLVLDAAGLALFAIAGAEKAMALGFSPLIAVIMAISTGCAGGMIRDLMTGRIPAILQHDEFYATCALLGAAFYVLVHGYVDPNILAFLSMLLIFVIRLLAVFSGVRLPVFLVAGLDHPPRRPSLPKRLKRRRQRPGSDKEENK